MPHSQYRLENCDSRNPYSAFLVNLAIDPSIRSQKVQSQQKVLGAAGLFGSYSNGRIFSSKIHRKHPHIPGSYRLTPRLQIYFRGFLLSCSQVSPGLCLARTSGGLGSYRKASERKATASQLFHTPRH